MMKRIFFSILLLLCFGAVQISAPKQSLAHHRCCCNSCLIHVERCSIQGCACASNNNVAPDKTHFTNEFIFHREWLIRGVWEANLLPAMLLMTEQMTSVAVNQTLSIGMLFDAKHQLESQRLLQTMTAQAHKDYHPSEGVCQFGTNTRSLAASDQNTNTVNIALSTQGMARQLLSGDTVSSSGTSSDSESRWVQFKEKYCNPSDNNNGFDELCTGSSSERYNRDIDFAGTIDRLYTLELDFINSAAGADEEDILALQSNLYSHNITPNFSDIFFMAKRDGEPVDTGSFLYMDSRSLVAQRQVAMASYNAITAMKSRGDDNVQPYIKAILQEVGIEETQAQELIGSHPSYYAQMELLTKKLYQTPTFYTDLYDKPTNIDRKDVAMQAIGLMQKRDIYNSLLRSEMMQSIWLETVLEQQQPKVSNKRRTSAETPIILETMEALK